MTWRPIDTAPRDCSLFLSMWRGTLIVVGWPHILEGVLRKKVPLKNPKDVSVTAFTLMGEEVLVEWNELKMWAPIAIPEAPK